MKKTIAVILAAAFLFSMHGPAFAQVHSAAAVGQIPVLNVPVGLGAMPMASSQSLGLQSAMPAGAMLTPGTLPTPAALEPSMAAAFHQKPVPVEQAGRSAKPVEAPKPSRLKQFVDGVKRVITGKSAEDGQAPQKPDYQGKLIERVVAISDMLEAQESGKPAEAESLRMKAEQVWDGSTAAEGEVQAPQVGPMTSVPSSLSKPEPLSSEKKTTLARAPPKPTPEQVVEERLSAWMDKIPGPARVAMIAGASLAIDAAAQMFLPGIFGFSGIANLWVTLGLGGVITPIVLSDRLRLAKEKDAAAAPLERHEDLLLGMMMGAIAAGVLSMILPVSIGAGGLSLASYVGLLGMMAALPLLYSSGHILHGLKHKRIVAPELPLPFLFKLLFLNMLIMPGRVFVALSTPALLPVIAGNAAMMTLLAYYLGNRSLTQMTIANASPEELAREKEYGKEPDMRGLLDPLPEFGPQWRVGNGPADTDKVDSAVRWAKGRAAFWIAAVPVVAVALFALHHMSLVAVVTEGFAGLAKHLVPMAIMFTLSGFIVTLVSRTKQIKEGPVYDMVKELAGKAGLPMPRVFASPDESKPPNAFASGAFYHLAVVAVIGSIRKLLTDRELKGVLGHELSHVKFRHMLSFLSGILSLQLLNLGVANMLQLFIAFWAPVIWTLAFLALMRTNEYMADAGAARITQDPRGLATGLRKLTIMSLLTRKVPGSAGNWLYRLLLTHPTSEDRVKALDGMMKKS